jgi:hypothetical protein
MATGKKALDIFTPSLKVTERITGRPHAPEPYAKVTITLYERQVLLLDRASLAIRERTGQVAHRAELIRAMVEAYSESLNPDGKDFDKTIRDLFPVLKD